MEEVFNFKNIIKTKDYKVIDICSTASGVTTLKQYYKNNNISDYCIIGLPLILSIGDIQYHLLDREILGNDFSDDIKELLDSINKDSTIRVWSSLTSSDDYLLFLYICNLLKNNDNNIEVIFTNNYDNAFTLGALDTSEIASVLESKLLLSKEDIDNYSLIFDELINNNSELRIIDNKEIINKNYSDYNEIILEILNKLEPCKISELVGNLLAKSITTSNSVEVYYHLVERLIANNEIEVIENKDRYYDSIIKKRVN